ncbi:MAG: flavin reductase family protein [Clostridia bacterium]|nr:flavin reductase family protein [Clostridia bacterium]
MEKKSFKPSTMLYPLPAVMASCGTMEESNIITIAWTGIICSDPPRTYISIAKQRYSHDIVENSGEFVINLTNADLARATDLCGCTTGARADKFKEAGLTKAAADIVSCPMIAEAPVNLECRVFKVERLGSHDMYMADILAVHVNEDLLDENGRICLEKAGLIAYSHGFYYGLGSGDLGRFGWSVMKPKTKKRINREKAAKAGQKRK